MILSHFTAKPSFSRDVSMATHIKSQPKLTTTVKTVLVILSFGLLSACQHMSQNDSSATWTHKAYAAGQATCLKSSRYSHPQVSGKIIDTDSYMLITMMNHSHGTANATSQTSKGELCIVNKKNGEIDITAIDRLRFLEGVQ